MTEGAKWWNINEVDTSCLTSDRFRGGNSVEVCDIEGIPTMRSDRYLFGQGIVDKCSTHCRTRRYPKIPHTVFWQR